MQTSPDAAPESTPHLLPKSPDPKIGELRQLLERHRGERQAIAIQDFPDPDALSCAWAYQLIARQYDIQCEIVYSGTLSHQENIALVKLTGLPVRRWSLPSAKDKDLSVYGGYVLIDSQGTTSQLTALLQDADIPLRVVIDHHQIQGDLQAEFVDIRTSVGATATILAQYLQGGLLDLDDNKSEHIQCATALMHGLRSDTDRLIQATEADFRAAAYLSRFYDRRLFGSILQSSRSSQVMEAIERSLRNRIVQKNVSIAGVGYLRYGDRDAIPQAADFLVTEENVHTAIVYGIVRDDDQEVELLVGSLRTSKITLDPDEFIKNAFDRDDRGRYYGGGRSTAGGFEIPIGFLSGYNEIGEYAQLKWQVFDAQVKQKLLRLIDPID